ncbi:unnamed protein product [Brassicogethes aeneus]|uniref:Uncharacterized protein n=1 Tax=Brassicogethes aeneus TaxID=1431903 RepID=A0A9P0BBL9_BRAAE|nr:unnamed protein product [Brassicogethes aeneus]
MFSLSVYGLVVVLALNANCQRYNGGGDGGEAANYVYRPQEPQSDYNSNYQNTPPPPQILSHKQALNHDGNFKYLFTSENGLAQGESIAPDGSRNGGYSYVDPTGRKIVVKYTAGKEGFRILEADHLPKAPLPVAPLPAPQQTQAAYSQPSYGGQNNKYDDGQYRPHLYERPERQESLPRYLTGAPPQQSYPQPRAAYAQPQPVYPRSAPQQSNNLEDKEPEYNDAPGKPHSFGTGYIFEFQG